jgi:hypothetical protein
MKQKFEKRPKSVDQRTAVNWATTPAKWIEGRSWVDEADLVAKEMEEAWGVGRLRLLVGPELREKFDRQRYRFNTAIYCAADLDEVKEEAKRMIRAWHALQKAAEAAGRPKLEPSAWEVALSDGRALTVVKSSAEAYALAKDGRARVVLTMDEVAAIFEAQPTILALKTSFPGARVVGVRGPSDALMSLDTTGGDLDDEIPF